MKISFGSGTVSFLTCAGCTLLAQPSSKAAKRAAAEASAETVPFKGITTNGTVEKGLFPIRTTNVSTETVRMRAAEFLTALTPEQRKKTLFPVNDPEWRKWMNQHYYVRQGARSAPERGRALSTFLIESILVRWRARVDAVRCEAQE